MVRTPLFLLVVLGFSLCGLGVAHAEGVVGELLGDLVDDFDPDAIETGILYDRVLQLSRIESYQGDRASEVVTLSEWRQVYHEIFRSSLEDPTWPSLRELDEGASAAIRRGVIPIAVMNFRYERIRPDALETGALRARDGRLVQGAGEAFSTHRVFAAAPLTDVTYRGTDLRFRWAREQYLTNDEKIPRRMEIDFEDGRGFVDLEFDSVIDVAYSTPGRKSVRLRLTSDDGMTLHAAFSFDVSKLRTPAPHDTLQITASIPYLGEFGTGEAYVYLSDDHVSLRDPVVVVEGFDLDNSMNWDELYTLLNREELLETLRAEGLDAVVLNFTNATDYMQRNAFVLHELLQQVYAAIEPEVDIAVVGASMGGLVARYTLAYMENAGEDHRARLFLSFDSPQKGAAIPLGMQYWLSFFAEESAEATELLAALDSPAARQLLVYHHNDPPETNPTSDPLRTVFMLELGTLGDYPATPRKVAVANGSSMQIDQGFGAGDQIILWEYYSFLVDIVGNVWAVPDRTSGVIFDGLIDVILLPEEELTVTVTGTDPYDNAPGGYRSSMADMDATQAPYGDIIALHPNHCFIPTVSALALDTDDLFYDIAGDPGILSLTPFDAVYFPSVNQEHIDITVETKQWLLDEILRDPAAIAEGELVLGLEGVRSIAPNPLRSETSIVFTLRRSGDVDLSVYDAAGRLQAVILDDRLSAGEHRVLWDGSNGAGGRLRAGLYFLRLRADEVVSSRKVVLR